MRAEWREPAAAGPPLGVVFGAVLALAAGLAALWLAWDLPLPVCQLRRATGVPCPTCGSTRMVVALLQGRIGGAFLESPLMFLVLAGVAAWAVASGVTRGLGGRVPKILLARGERVALRIAAVAALAASWVYLIWRGA